MTDAHEIDLDETVEHLITLNRSHVEGAGALQQTANRISAALAHPGVVLAILVGSLALLVSHRLGLFDGLFAVLAGEQGGFWVSFAGLIVAILVLSAQRHDQLLTLKHSELSLQIALLNERKIGKVITMLDEQRRANPLLPPDRDAEAEALAQTSDPIHNLQRIEERLRGA